MFFPDGDGKPEIVNGLKPVSVKPGERAAFEVETKGPVKQVKWLVFYFLHIPMSLSECELLKKDFK